MRQCAEIFKTRVLQERPQKADALIQAYSRYV